MKRGKKGIRGADALRHFSTRFAPSETTQCGRQSRQPSAASRPHPSLRSGPLSAAPPSSSGAGAPPPSAGSADPFGVPWPPSPHTRATTCAHLTSALFAPRGHGARSTPPRCARRPHREAATPDDGRHRRPQERTDAPGLARTPRADPDRPLTTGRTSAPASPGIPWVRRTRPDAPPTPPGTGHCCARRSAGAARTRREALPRHRTHRTRIPAPRPEHSTPGARTAPVEPLEPESPGP